MTTITLFEDKFCGKNHNMYSVNNRKPKNSHSHMTTSEVCPACNERNIFRFYEPKMEFEEGKKSTAIYDCKCPGCGAEFDVKDEFIDED